MNKFSKYTFILFSQLLLVGSLLAQDAMKISGTQIVRKGETMVVEAGKVLQFEPGATLQIEGSLVVRGTSEKPVIMQSVDPSNPGTGIMVRGIDEGGSVVMENVKCENLIQALRFDPFWYRKKVELNSVSVFGSNSGEPVLYVAGPLLDLRDGMDIQFSMKSMKFYNNTGAVLLEKVGSDGIVYDLDNLLFSENHLPGSDATMGVLHLDVARISNAAQVKLGNLAFNRNISGDKTVGLSVSGGNGTGAEKFPVDAIYALGNTVVYDNRVNSRVPSLEINKVSALQNYSQEKDFVIGAKHNFGKVKMNVVGNPKVVKLEDSLGRPVFNNANRVGDTLILSYLEGNPSVVTLANGQKFMVPKLTTAELPPPIYRKVDTTLISPRWPDTTQQVVGPGNNKVDVAFSIPTFGGKGDITKLGYWEGGFWAGGAIFGGGDVPHAYFPFPSTIELSGGTYAQYNPTDRFAVKISYYKYSVSMHNIWAPGVLSRAGEVMGVDTNGNEIIYSKGFSNMFLTEMQSLEFEMLWHLKPYSLGEGRKYRIVPTIGVGFGFCSFDPYRITLKSQKKDETYADYKKRLWSEYKFSLRDMGTEGQNILPGMKPYGRYAALGNVSFGLTYLRNRWTFKGEMKAVITTTDYLDDMGSGAWYGGDYEAWKEELQTHEIYLRDGSTVGKLSSNYNPSADPNASRSTNNLTDGYFQMHMGLSYNFSSKKKKEFEPLGQY